MSERNPAVENRFRTCGKPVRAVNNEHQASIHHNAAEARITLPLKSQEEREMDSNWVSLGEAVTSVVKQLAEKFAAQNSEKREVKHERANAA